MLNAIDGGGGDDVELRTLDNSSNRRSRTSTKCQKDAQLSFSSFYLGRL